MTRPIKRSKTKLENLIMETWNDTSRGTIIKDDGQRCVMEAIKDALRYFEMEDYLYGSNHVVIIRKTYLSGKKSVNKKDQKLKRDKTRAALANELYIGRNTLSSYTDIYIKCFEKNLNDLLIKE